MKVLRLHGIRDLRISDEPIPVSGNNEKLLQVKAAGICGSDLHWFKEGGIGDARLSRPLVLGHEFAGLTETGELVAVDPAISCGACEFCLRGDTNLCPEVRFAGHGETDGGLREYLCWDSSRLFPLPVNLTAADGVMLEPLGVAIHAVDLAHMRAGMTVGLFGCGPIGLLILQLARLAGAEQVIATDILSHRVQAARDFGASQAFLVAGRWPAE
jgi:L-iditol 2-dehydrogenase